MSGQAEITEEWKIIARKDWQRVRRNLEDEDAEAAGFFLQQSLEKYLKAYLLEHGWKLKKIHVLHELLVDALIYNSLLEAFRTLVERVSGYYLAERYPPLVLSDLSCKDRNTEDCSRRRLGLPSASVLNIPPLLGVIASRTVCAVC